jgi:hypothetical protein
MPESHNYEDFEALDSYLDHKIVGNIRIADVNCIDYAGLGLRIGIMFDTRIPKYELDLQWISFGLDLFGDTLVENYTYRFDSLSELLLYLSSRYGIKITDIPIEYRFNKQQFPNPIYDASRDEEFKAAWERFQQDFKRGTFLDPSQHLVFSTQHS